MIKIMQEWQNTAFLEPHIHLWHMFIKPRELIAMLTTHGLVNQDLKGLGPGPNVIAHYLNLRRRARGRIGWAELSRRLRLRINTNLTMTYIGYALKLPGSASVRRQARHGPFLNRPADDSHQDGQHHTQPPDSIVVAGAVIQPSAQPDPAEAANLMTLTLPKRSANAPANTATTPQKRF